jgi:NTP pyrophosphatase (non-canonical NTP hydrolase)
MNFNEYQINTRRTEPDLGNKKLPYLNNYAMGLSGESGEVTDHMKKVLFQGHKLDEEDMAYELGDLLFYTARFADVLGYDLSEIAKMNERKLKNRFPDGFTTERSVNRDD